MLFVLLFSRSLSSLSLMELIIKLVVLFLLLPHILFLPYLVMFRDTLGSVHRDHAWMCLGDQM